MLIEESLNIDLTQTISLLKIRCPEILGKKNSLPELIFIV